MFDKLIDVVLSLWSHIIPWFVVDEWQRAIVLRFGRFHAEVGPGFHWKIPAVDRSIEVDTVTFMQDLSAQSVGEYVFRAVLSYRIVDAKAFLLKVGGGRDALQDAALGVLGKHVQADPDAHAKAALREIRKRARAWGIEVDKLSFADHAKAPTYRVVGLPDGVHSAS